MTLDSFHRLLSALLLLALCTHSLAFPSLSHLQLKGPPPPLPPAPQNFTGLKLVDDPAHPWMAPRPGDMRGPCPGLNTLASHGYIPRTGVATPGQIITGVQEGFNLEYAGAALVLYATMLVCGNPMTDLVSIGGRTPLTGPDPPGRKVGGLSAHNFIEGDGSMSREDVFFDPSQKFNQAKFNTFKSFSAKYGGGFYNLTVAAQLRNHLIQTGIKTNPNFTFLAPRTFAAYIESTLPVNMFVDGRHFGTPLQGQLNMADAESFFKHSRFPKGFHRAPKPSGSGGIEVVFGSFPNNRPGKNVNGVNTFQVDESHPMLPDWCAMYTKFVGEIVPREYPNPTGTLKRNLNIYAGYLYEYSFLKALGCAQVFPYGQD